MERNKLFVDLAKYSLFLGGILGFLGTIPFINILAVLAMSVFASSIIIYYFQHKRIIGELSMKGGAVLGAIIGVIAASGFLIIALPLYAILSYIPFINNSFSLLRNLWQISWLLFPMTWIITAPLNAAGLMAYIYIRDTFFMIENSGKERIFRPDFFKKDE